MTFVARSESNGAKALRAFKISLVGNIVSSIVSSFLVVVWLMLSFPGLLAYDLLPTLGWILLLGVCVAQTITLPVALAISLFIVYVRPIRRREAIGIIVGWSLLIATGVEIFGMGGWQGFGILVALFCGVVGFFMFPLVARLTRNWHTSSPSSGSSSGAAIVS